MAVTIEKRVNALEDEVRALKAIYTIAGGLAKMYVETSGEMTVGGGSTPHAMKVKFTPTYGAGQENIITLTPVLRRVYPNGSYDEYIPTFRVEPQTGNGDVVAKVYNVVGDDRVRFIASGTSPGTFTRIS